MYVRELTVLPSDASCHDELKLHGLLNHLQDTASLAATGLEGGPTMYLTKEMNCEVYAASANTDGFSEEQLRKNEENAYKLGATRYVTLDVTQEYYAKSLKYMIFGNVLRNGTYPVSVSSERIFQGMAIVYERK